MASRCFLLLLSTAPCLVPGERIYEHGLDAVKLLAQQEANASQRLYWDLFGSTGVKMTDVSQGRLGNCYYLAGLAAIAHTHPKLIEQAFIMRGEPSKARKRRKVYQVKFLLDGVETIVAMDEVVPVRSTKGRGYSGSFHFASTNDGDDVWPILMEKGWAKLFGSYVATRGGWGHEPLKALTQAPVHYLSTRWRLFGRYWPDTDLLWETMKDAVKNSFPMTASSVKNSFGVVSGHAFAVIDIGGTEKKRTVKVYNPWAANRYSGELMTDKEQQDEGTFSLTFEEFQQAFRKVFFAHVRPNYRVSFKRIPMNEPVALKFTMAKKATFAVQLEWPNGRFVDAHGCRLDPHHAKLLVGKQGVRGSWKSAQKALTMSNLRVDFEDKGTYLVYAYFSLEGAPVVPQVALNVYAGEDVTFLEVDKPPLDVGREILGFPCKYLVKPGLIFSYFDDVYEAVPFAVGGSPAWRLWYSTTVIWLGEHGSLTRAPGLDQLEKEPLGFPFPFESLECRDEVSDKEADKEHPEEVVYEEPSGCGFKLGDRVEYRSNKDTDTWVCAEVKDIDPSWGGGVEVRFRGTKTESVSCSSADLKKVTQCKFQEGDEVEVKKSGGRWVSDVVSEVGCGSLELVNNGQVDCGANRLRYRHGCPFSKNEKVIVWNQKLEEWHNAKVVRVTSDQVTVVYHRQEKALPCDDHDRVRKLSRCEKVTHDQIERFSKLNNIREIMDEGKDSLFPPNLGSIGPPTADCGDSADGSGPKPCDEFNYWEAISDVLH